MPQDLTLAEVLRIQAEQGYERDRLPDGVSWCTAPDCDGWERGKLGNWWEHTHEVEIGPVLAGGQVRQRE